MKPAISLFLLLSLACSGRSDSASDTTAGDTAVASAASEQTTCALVPDAEVAGAIGQPVERHESPAPNRCVYYTANPVVFVDIEVDRENGAAAWQGISTGDSLIGAPEDSLTGIGDKAFFGPRDRLYIMKGNSFAAIEAGFDDKVRERARAVAKVVVAKL